METAAKQDTAKIAFDYINATNRHVFLTGKAGTGKTTFLRRIVSDCHKRTIVAAPTGIAAINAGGVTLHSLFHLPFGVYVPDLHWKASGQFQFKVNTAHTLLSGLQMNETKRKMLRELELLIIDEVSMLRADLLDAIDEILRHVRHNHRASFGGVQVLFIGDMLQLPPVVRPEESQLLRKYYRSCYFFDACSLKQDKPVYIELDKVYRQSDPLFLNLLNNLRLGEPEDKDLTFLNSRVIHDFKTQSGDGFIHLVTHNNKADFINQEALQRLPDPVMSFFAQTEGDFPEYLYPIERIMDLKKNAQVMFIKNDSTPEKKYFNGKIGIVDKLESDLIEVIFNDGSPSVKVERYTWENRKYTLNEKTNQIEEEIIGRFMHFPLKLAWAITIHKSQGLTFDKAIADVSAAFAPGQVYVALSRLRTIEGLVLTQAVDRTQILKDYTLLAYNKQKTNQRELCEDLQSDSRLYFRKFVLQAFNFQEFYEKTAEHAESYQKEVLRIEKQKHEKWGQNLLKQLEDVKVVSDRFITHVEKMFEKHDGMLLSKLLERVSSAIQYFSPLFDSIEVVLKDHIQEIQQAKKAKGYLEELVDLDNVRYRQWQEMKRAESLLVAAVNGNVISKQTVTDQALLEKRLAEQILAVSEREDQAKTEKKKKAPKGESKTLSLTLFREGKTVLQIAEERGMAVSTIESHLTWFVGTGELEIHLLVPEFKIGPITDAIKSTEPPLASSIREKLGGEYSFSEIRAVIKHLEFTTSA